MSGYPCHIDAAKSKYYPNFVSFAFPKDSPFVALFSAKILVLKQSGEVDKLIRKYLVRKKKI